MEPGDVVGLSDAICKLLDDPGMARALGKAGQQHIRQILSLEYPPIREFTRKRGTRVMKCQI